MKKTQLILAAALVALAACENKSLDLNGPQTLDNEIGFNAVTRKATKANDAIINGAVYDTLNTFRVWGWQTEKEDAAAYSDIDDADPSNFMSNLKIEWTDGRLNRAKAWRNDDNYYYWPFTGGISFLAIHPYEIATAETSWDESNTKPMAKIENYTLEGRDSTDLMFAYNKGTRQATPLNMVFKHALSQIVVSVKTDTLYTPDVTFDVDSVYFNNIDLTGDVLYKNEVIEWSENDDQTEKWVYFGETKANIDDTLRVYGHPLVMIPQDANNATTISIRYTMTQHNCDPISGKVTIAAPWMKVKEGETTSNPAVAFDAWEPGKKYNYSLNFKLNEILFTPSVTDWVEVDVQTINILD